MVTRKIALVLALLWFTPFCFAQSVSSSPVCSGSHKGQILTRTQFLSLLKEPSVNLCGVDIKNVDLQGVNLKGVNLSGADLSGSDFTGANLQGAMLQKAYFRSAILKGSDLRGADLQGANFQTANLAGARLDRAKLQDANFMEATLTNATLRFANLTGASMTHMQAGKADFAWAVLTKANLTFSELNGANFQEAKLMHADFAHSTLKNVSFKEADLQGASLDQTDLTNASFRDANMQGVLFQPKFQHLPNLTALALSKNFRDMRLKDHSGVAALTELRSAYKKTGIRPMEQAITAMIKTNQMRDQWQAGGWGYLESAFSYVLFYLTSDFGADPGRPLIILMVLIFLFTIPYRVVMSFPNKYSGVLVFWKPKRYYQWDEVSSEVTQVNCRMLISENYSISQNFWFKQLRFLRIAFYFSLLSASSIGWHDLNLRNWISRMQARDYRLQGKGWVSFFSGLQPILSAYLVVLWLLTYFGHPFQW